MTESEILSQSRALWNRVALDLESDEVLAQILDRGSMEDWRALYRLARGAGDREESASCLRRRILCILTTVPLPLPHFWLAALESLDDPHLDLSDVARRIPAYPAEACI